MRCDADALQQLAAYRHSPSRARACCCHRPNACAVTAAAQSLAATHSSAPLTAVVHPAAPHSAGRPVRDGLQQQHSVHEREP